MLEFRLLGPVELRADGQSLPAGPPRQRLVLAALLFDAGRLVTWETVADRVWGDAVPRDGHHSLQAHISRLRGVLRRAAGATGEPLPIVFRSGGYVLEAEPATVDLHRFRDLITRAVARDRSSVDRLALLRDALALWRGEPLSGLAGPWPDRVRLGLHQRRLDALVEWADAEAHAGDPAVTIGPLSELADERPLAESVAAALMRALCAVGRPADALAHYEQARRHLAEELGADPGPKLQAVHQAVLRGATFGDAAPSPSTPRVVPTQLPPDVPDFTGRAGDLARLDELLSGVRFRPVAVVAGTAGVGKTAVVLHWAHRVRERFPDGQLYLNLRGYDPDRPLPPDEAVARLLVTLGVQSRDVPLHLDERAARWRTELAGRRILVVLDNAASAEQVRPLLAGTSSCVVAITSRNDLAGLVASDGARRLDLDLLPPADARRLLRRLVGERVEQDPVSATALADLCARLPLALRVAAELAVTRPVRMADLVTELADERRRLDLLDAGGDPRSAVAAVFSWSVDRLPAPVARAFALLGLHPGAEFDHHALAALAGIGAAAADRTLVQLTRAHLVAASGAHRYTMHDLLKAYAATLVEEAAVRPALGRLFDFYLAAAAHAAEVLHPGQRRPLSVPEPVTPLPSFTGPAEAREWLDAERATLTAVTRRAARDGWARHCIDLSTVLVRYLDGGSCVEALEIHGNAAEAARTVGDLVAEAHAVTNVGAIYSQLSAYERGADHIRRALDLFRRVEDPFGQARAVGNLGMIEGRLSRYAAAAGHLAESASLYRTAGDHAGEGRALTNLGFVEMRLGRYRDALAHFGAALECYRSTEDLNGRAHLMTNTALVEERLGNLRRAEALARQALEVFRRTGYRTGEAYALTNLGSVQTGLGQIDEAARSHRRALEMFRDIGDRDGEAWARNGLGEAALAGGDPAAPRDRAGYRRPYRWP